MNPPKDRSRHRSQFWPNSSDKGLVRHIGLSNVTPAQIAEAQTDRSDRLRAEPVQPGASKR